MSTPPWSARTRLIIASHCSRSERSVGYTKARPPPTSISPFNASSFSLVRETSTTFAPCRPTSCAVARPMPLDAPVTTTTRSLQNGAKVAFGRSFWVEVALPVVPDLPRICMQRRTLDAAARKGRLRLVARELRAVGHVLQGRLGDAHAFQQSAFQGLRHVPVLEHAGHLSREHRSRPAIEPQGELRRMGGAAELVGDLAKAARGGIGEMKSLAVEVGLGSDLGEGTRDEIDRDDVDLTAFETHERHPGRDGAAKALDELERVVRTVDAVGRARLGRADDKAGPVDAVGNERCAHQALSLVLGLVIRMVQSLARFEHLLRELAFPLPSGDSDRAHVVESGAQLLRQRDYVARAADVRPLVGLV